MNNIDVEAALNACKADLDDVLNEISKVGGTATIAPYLTKFAIIRACGTIESSFKGLITDFCCRGSKTQVVNFINYRIKDGSANPSWQILCKFIKEFDVTWHSNLKKAMQGKVNEAHLRSSLDSLVTARNTFAHGGNPTSTIGDVVTYFIHSREIIEELDKIIV